MVSDSPLKILFFPFMAHGHILPMVDMAKLFARRGGVHAAIFTSPANAALIQPSLADHLLVQLLVVPFPSGTGLPQGVEMVSQLPSADMGLLFFQAMSMFTSPFDRILKEFQPDCVITDTFLPWTCDVAADNGIPRLVFHGNNFFARCCYDGLDRYEVMDHLPLDADGEECVTIPGLPHDIKLLKSQIGVPRSAEFFTRIKESDSRSYGVVFNSFYELEPDYADHYRNVVGQKAWHVGPVSLCNTERCRDINDASVVNSKDCMVDWLDSKSPRSVVYVCFGSMADFSRDQIPQLALGLEASNHPFVWVVRNKYEGSLPQGFEERTRRGGKGFIIKGWAPQILILNHKAIGCVVTHCGWNSSLEAISAGVPLITWPMFAEQFYNERLIVDVLKIGVPVGVKKFASNPEEREVMEAARVEQAVERVMGDGEEAVARRSRAQELGEMARRAVEKEEGSSYVDLGSLIQELKDRRRTTIEYKQ